MLVTCLSLRTVWEESNMEEKKRGPAVHPHDLPNSYGTPELRDHV